MKTITSANSTFTLTAPDVFATPQAIQGYAADAAFATEAVDLAEVQMGVDAHMAAGFTPAVKKMTITLMPDSDSIDTFDAIRGAMEQAREILYLGAVITIPSINKSYQCTKGVLTQATPVPEAKKVLGPPTYQITWESIVPIPLA